MILVWGAKADPPLCAVLDALHARGADVLHLDSDLLAAMDFDVTFDPMPAGWLAVQGRRIPLEPITAMYLRPESERRPAVQPAAACLLTLASCIDATVVNRPVAGQSNLTKPYQLSLIARAGFCIPPTLVTSDPDAARSFLHAHGRIIYKSISGVRSIVGKLDGSGACRLAGIATGPVQLQRLIAGIDVRVHVVGERCFAAAIETEATDYRYPKPSDDVTFRAIDLDAGLEQRLIELAAGMGLLVAGIDLRHTPEGEWFCLEVNPSPGFTFFEDATGQPIAAAIAELLCRDRAPADFSKQRSAAPSQSGTPAGAALSE